MFCLLQKRMQPKLIHDDSACACERGLLISLGWSARKLDSFLRFTNDDHYGKFTNRISAVNMAFSSVSF